MISENSVPSCSFSQKPVILESWSVLWMWFLVDLNVFQPETKALICSDKLWSAGVLTLGLTAANQTSSGLVNPLYGWHVHTNLLTHYVTSYQQQRLFSWQTHRRNLNKHNSSFNLSFFNIALFTIHIVAKQLHRKMHVSISVFIND